MTLAEALSLLRARSMPVPIPARLPSIDEVDAMQARLGVQFHADYRQFLLEASDVVVGTLEPATITNPKAHTYLPEVVSSARACGVPGDLFAICEDNSDYYCIANDGGVRFWSHDGATNETWPTLATWIERVWLRHEPA